MSGPTDANIHIAADHLNRLCACVGVEHERLRDALAQASGNAALYDQLKQTHPYLFSDVAVFLAQTQADRIYRLVAAVEHAVGLAEYQKAIGPWTPATAAADFGPSGAFLGYDFHLAPDGPQLIEINTNAGGAMLSTVLARAHRACCGALQHNVETAANDALENTFVEMFRAEWRRQRHDQPLRRIAIVDDAPEQQYLYPEFVLFQRLFERAGIETIIVDAGALRYENGALSAGALAIDLVYNRLTDFALEQPAHRALRDAYLAGDAVVTPHPRAHALYADKRNLTLLSDASLLRRWNVPEATITDLVNHIPRTLRVDPAQREHFWANRGDWFFKPAAGFGGRATYRGEKITRTKFEEVLHGNYVAQAEITPSERRMPVEGETPLKLDIRCYVFRGQVQLYAARLYRGQTTNFRTPGGGFAPVYVLPDIVVLDDGTCLGNGRRETRT